MVGGLVENQEVDRLQEQANHGQATTLAATEHLDFLVGCLATKHKGTEDIIDTQTDVSLCHIIDGLEHGEILIEQLCLVLCKIANLHVMPHLQRTLEGNLAHDTFHQGRFSLTVLTYESNLLTALDGEVHVVEDDTVVGFLHLVADHGIVARAEAGRELQVHGGIIHLVHLDNLHLLQLAQSLLHLYSLSWLIAETLYEIAYISHLLLLVLIGTELLFTALFSEHHILVIFHTVVNHTTTGNLQRTVGHIIDKGTVVTDQYHCPTPRSQQLFEPLDRLNIEVVGGLVEQQHIRTAQQDLGQLDTHTPTARELGGRTVKVGTLEA